MARNTITQQQPIKYVLWQIYKSRYLKQRGGIFHFSFQEAEQIGQSIGIDWNTSLFDIDQYQVGLEVELEHGTINSITNVTNNDPIATGKIALAHLTEMPDYYYRLLRMEFAANIGTGGD